jgi:thiol:disulfide interchange protein
MAPTNQRAIPIALIAIAALLLIARVASHFMKEDAPRASSSRVQWMSLADGLATARASNKPVLYDFTAEWCAPCHLLDAQVFQDEELAATINERFVPIRVTDRQQEEGRNTPEVASLQQRYGVNGFPTVVFASADGLELARMDGFRGAEEFRKVMERVR